MSARITCSHNTRLQTQGSFKSGRGRARTITIKYLQVVVQVPLITTLTPSICSDFLPAGKYELSHLSSLFYLECLANLALHYVPLHYTLHTPF